MSHMNRMGETGCSSLIAKFYIKITFHLDFTLFTSIYILVYSHGIGFLILIFHCPKCHVHVCTNVVLVVRSFLLPSSPLIHLSALDQVH